MPIVGTSQTILPALTASLRNWDPHSNQLRIPVVTGPTASGKTSLCFEAASLLPENVPLNVVSADAFQVFIGMDIGTAKPLSRERRRLPHHCIDILEPTEYFSAAKYARTAEDTISNLIKDEQIPIVCGGSGLYLTGLIDGIAESAGPDPLIRSADLSKQELLERLVALDPAAASELSGGPRHRVLRALEIVKGAGMPLSEWKLARRQSPRFRFQLFVLMPDRENLYASINSRVDQMFNDGFVEEVQTLRAQGILPGLQSQRAIGYREIHSHLDGALNLDRTLELTKRNTRRLAKRQITWCKGVILQQH